AAGGPRAARHRPGDTCPAGRRPASAAARQRRRTGDGGSGPGALADLRGGGAAVPPAERCAVPARAARHPSLPGRGPRAARRARAGGGEGGAAREAYADASRLRAVRETFALLEGALSRLGNPERAADCCLGLLPGTPDPAPLLAKLETLLDPPEVSGRVRDALV